MSSVDILNWSRLHADEKAIEDALYATSHLIGDAGEPTFTNSWINDSGAYKAGFRLIGKNVFLWGLIRNGASGNPAWTLPAAFRPGAEVRLVAWDSTNNVACSIRVQDTGPVIPVMTAGATVVFGLVVAIP